MCAAVVIPIRKCSRSCFFRHLCYARGDMTEDSDLDLRIDKGSIRRPELAGLLCGLEDALAASQGHAEYRSAQLRFCWFRNHLSDIPDLKRYCQVILESNAWFSLWPRLESEQGENNGADSKRRGLYTTLSTGPTLGGTSKSNGLLTPPCGRNAQRNIFETLCFKMFPQFQAVKHFVSIGKIDSLEKIANYLYCHFIYSHFA